MPGGLQTDLYELNMAASYLRRGMTAPATFSLYVRGLPPRRGFLVAAGLEACLGFLEGFSFANDELDYLSTLGFDDRALDDFAGLRFDGDVWAIPEGRVFYSEEPVLEVTAPMPIAQIAETALLNLITLHATLASKAARYALAAGDRDLVDFSFRRTHGPDAAMASARSSAIAGFTATSNVEAARRYGLRAAGTMAHAFIEAFPDERHAFEAFAQDHPDRTTFLVDTYDTLRGVEIAIDTIRSMRLDDHLGVRLDSGDLDTLSRSARRLLDDAGLTSAAIFASGGLDELEVARLVSSGAPIDAFGIGTQMGVSADAPFVDSVYKLVEYDGRATLKLSADKVSAPGRKQVWRSLDDAGHHGDVLTLRDEPPIEGAGPLLEQVMRGGRRVGATSLDHASERFRSDLAGVPKKARRLGDPKPPTIARSEALRALTERVTDEVLRRSEASPDASARTP